MTHRATAHLISFLIAALAALPTGCDHIDDAPKLRDEAIATATSYDARLVELGKRILVIAPHVATPPGRIKVDAIAMAAIQSAGRTIDKAREELSQVKGKAESEAKLAETEAYAKHVEALEKLIAETHDHADEALRVGGAQLDAAESWLMVALDKQAEQADQAAPSGSSENSVTPGAPGSGGTAAPQAPGQR